MIYVDEEIKRGLGYHQLNLYFPIKIDEAKIEKEAEEKRQQQLRAMEEYEKRKPMLVEKMNGSSGKQVNIDLSTMVKNGEFESNYVNGLLTMNAKEAHKANYFATPQKFNAPLKINVRAMTDGSDIRIRYGNGR